MKKIIVGLVICASICISAAPVFAQIAQVKSSRAVVHVAKFSWGSPPVDVAKFSWGSAPVNVAKFSWGSPTPNKFSWG